MEKPRTRFDVLNDVLKSDEKAKSEARIGILEEALKKGRGAKKEAPPLDPNRNRALREKLGIGKKVEGGKNDVAESEIRENLEATEADWEKMEDDLDWMAREEETKSILGVEGMEKIERLRQEAAGEIEAAKKKAPPPEPVEKVIVESQESEGKGSKKEMEKSDDYYEEFRMPGESQEKGVDESAKKKEKSDDYYEEFRMPGESQEKGVDESAKKKEKSAAEKKTPEKLSLTELDSRVNALWGAMEKILQDAADFKPKKEEAKAMKKWIKKGQGVEDWPLDDKVTANNYKKRLEKYGIADLIDPSKIEPHNDAYAVVSKQYKAYRDELEGRIRKIKLGQLEEAEGKATSKKEKKEREEDVVMKIKTELSPTTEDLAAKQEQKDEIRESLEEPKAPEGTEEILGKSIEGWGGRTREQILAERKIERMGTFDAQEDVLYAESAQSQVVSANKKLANLEATVDDEEKQRQLKKIEEATKMLELTPPEARTTAEDRQLTSALDQMSENYHKKIGELGLSSKKMERLRRKNRLPKELADMEAQIKELQGKRESKIAHKILEVARAMALPSAEHLSEKFKTGDKIYILRGEKTPDEWELAYITERGNAILQRGEGDNAEFKIGSIYHTERWRSREEIETK